MSTDTQLQEKYQMLLPHLDEKSARLFLASEAKSMERGDKVKVAKLAGVSRARINKGIKELESGIKSSEADKGKRIRKAGGGRKSQKESQPGMAEALERIVNPHTLGDPVSLLLCTNKSLRKIPPLPHDCIVWKKYILKPLQNFRVFL